MAVAFIKPKAAMAALVIGAFFVGPAHSGTTTKVVRDHRGQNSNQLPPPKDPGWGNDSGATVRDHRSQQQLPCAIPGQSGSVLALGCR